MEDNKSFEELLNELDTIIRKLDDKDISLDESVSSYTKAIEISKRCNDILSQKIELVTKQMTEMGLTDFNKE
ncbi:MAG: exodeoxyribonuclease VII small subunit [Acholeplasmatales bacterium]|nr:exodeoxyribonuclease VII small subunit [Acholeplasmatales bacterium]